MPATDDKHAVWVVVFDATKGGITADAIAKHGLLDVKEYHTTTLDADSKCGLLVLGEAVRAQMVRRFLADAGVEASLVAGYAKNMHGMLEMYSHKVWGALVQHVRGKNDAYAWWCKDGARREFLYNLGHACDDPVELPDADIQRVMERIDKVEATVNEKLDKILAVLAEPSVGEKRPRGAE